MTPKARTADVVIVGGGIAGGSLATVLARSGIDVLVLERQSEYADHVKGECMLPWGVTETERLGLYDVLVQRASAHRIPRWVPYSEVSGPDGWPPIVLANFREDAHALDFRHPRACEALVTSAAEAGAELLRGVGLVSLDSNGRPAVTFEHEGEQHRVEGRLVVAADGRNSSIRKQARVPMHTEAANHVCAGLLVSGLLRVPMDQVTVGFSDTTFALSFPQDGGWSRVYSFPAVNDRGRYSDADRTRRFLADVAMPWFPGCEELPDASPEGPCRTYTGDDTWVEEPARDGLLLIGDAAGYTSPIIGSGLSSALRDVRIVADIMTRSKEWTSEAFSSYTEERYERMRRLRFISQTNAAMWVGPGSAQRVVAGAINMGKDPDLRTFQTANLHGPELGGPEAYSEDVRKQILAPLS